MDYLSASQALNMLAGRKHRDDGHAAQLLRELQPQDHEILQRAGLTPQQFSEGIDLDDAELLQSAIYQAKQPRQSSLSNSDYANNPNDIVIPGAGRVDRNSELGQMLSIHYPTEVVSRPATSNLIQEVDSPPPPNPRYQPTTGEGTAAWNDRDIEWRKNPTAANQGAMPMIAGRDTYDPVISSWLQGNQVNPETKTTPLEIRKRQSVKSRWEPFAQTETGLQPIPVGDIPINPQGFFDYTANHPKVEKLRALNNEGNLKWQYVERPITSAIQNLADTSSRTAQDWGEDTSKFYQSAITPEMLDKGLPLQRQLQSVDQVLGGINREEAYQQQLGNLESREVYNKPRDLKPPGSEYGNYNLAFKYANVSDQMGLNDAYNQQWGERAPRNYSAYSGGPLRYNDAGVGIGFGDKNLQPNVELAGGVRNYLPVSETYTSAPQWAAADPREPKRNVVPLQPEVVDLPAMQKQQELLRQHLAADTPQPAGTMKMTSGKETFSPMSFTPGEAIPGVFEQVLDAKGNPIMQDVLDADGKPSMVKQYRGERLIDVPQQRAQVVPFVPARDPVFRDEQLGNAMVQVGDQLVPYAGSAGVSLGRTELPRDPSIVPDAVEAMQQLERSGRNQFAQGNVSASSPTANSDISRRSYAGADTAANQLSNARQAMTALQAIDPAMNVESQQFDVDVNVRPGQSGNAVYDLMSRHGLNPVASAAGDYDRITGGGELPVGEQVKLAQGLRRTLAPTQMIDSAIADPELAHLRNQWQGEREAVMGKTAKQLAAIKELHGERRLDRVGRPGESTVDVWQSKVNPNTAGIDRLSSAIENANYKGDQSMRQNLNFYPDDDWGMLGQDVHPLDRVVTPTSNFQMQMAQQNPAFDFTPSNTPPEYMGQQRAVRAPGGQMTYTPPPFEFDPSQAEPTYTGQGRRAPGGGMSHVPAASNPWYRTKAGMAGIGGAAALTLGALAYSQMQRKQAEEDLRSQQLMAATGWQ